MWRINSLVYVLHDGGACRKIQFSPQKKGIHNLYAVLFFVFKYVRSQIILHNLEHGEQSDTAVFAFGSRPTIKFLFWPSKEKNRKEHSCCKAL